MIKSAPDAEMMSWHECDLLPEWNFRVVIDALMRDICKKLDIESVRPHDLRRTHGTMITSLGFGRDIMNRIQNHREGGIADVYDRHRYEEETRW